jgi:hypothetical protein
MGKNDQWEQLELPYMEQCRACGEFPDYTSGTAMLHIGGRKFSGYDYMDCFSRAAAARICKKCVEKLYPMIKE